MSAPITEAHVARRKFAQRIFNSIADNDGNYDEAAQMLAASEARAVEAVSKERDQLRAECERLKEQRGQSDYYAAALSAEAELAFQVARNSDLFTQRDEAVELQGKAEAELATEQARLNAVERYMLSRHKPEGPGDDEPKLWLGRGYFNSLRAAADTAMKEAT